MIRVFLAGALLGIGLMQPAMADQKVGQAGQWSVRCEWQADTQSAKCAAGATFKDQGYDTVLVYYPLQHDMVAVDTGAGFKVVLRVDQSAPQSGFCQSGVCKFSAALVALAEQGQSLSILLSANGKPSAAATRSLADLARAAQIARDWASQEASRQGERSTRSSGGAAPPPSSALKPSPAVPPSRPSPLPPPSAAPSQEKKIGEFGLWGVLCDLAVREDLGKCLAVTVFPSWGGDKVLVNYAARQARLFAVSVIGVAFEMAVRVDNGVPYIGKCQLGLCRIVEGAFYDELASGAKITLQLTAAGKPPFSAVLDVATMRQAAEAMDAWLALPPAQR